MKKIIIICILLISSLLASCTELDRLAAEREYCKSSGWDVPSDTFKEKYQSLYYNEICRLKNLYEMTCEEEIKTGIYTCDYYLFCEEYTIIITTGGYVDHGSFGIHLYYYGKGDNIDAYEEYSNVVDFLNDFTKYAGYDTVTEGNEFERLYYEAQENGKGYSYNFIHYDAVVGNVSYQFQTEYDGANYYKGENSSDIKEKQCHYFKFSGLLKPLI